jgi:large subunit ribosomal protein L24
MTKIKKGDKVLITTGREKGKEGTVLVVDHKKDRVIVEGRNLVKRHMKSRGQGQEGGIIQKENFIHISNVAYIHKGKPAKIGFSVEKKEVDGKTKTVKHRIIKATGEVID